MFRCEMLFNRTIISFSRKHVNIFTVLILIFGVSPPNNPSSPAGFHRFDENGGRVEIDYVVDMEHAVVTRNKFQITVKQMGEVSNG